MTRRESREHLIKMLYCKDFHEDDQMQQQLELYIQTVQMEPEDAKSFTARFNDILSHINEIDEVISANCVGWKISRIAKVDLCILRLAVFEIKFDDTIPEKVSINEAVEIAKIYGQENSAGFINGVLAKIL